MRILHIETGRHLYGGALQVFYLIRGLSSLSHENILACVPGSEIASRCKGLAKVIEIPMRGELDPRFLIGVLKAIRNFKPQLIHVHSRKGADLWGGMAAKLSRVPAVVTRRVDNPEIPVLARLKYKMYTRIITISQEIKRVLISEGIPESKITCIYSAVDSEEYNRECDREWFCSEFSLAPDDLVIGMIAQFIPRKGHYYLLRVVSDIVKEVPNAKFLLFGKGPLKKKIKLQSKKLDLTKYVMFVGFRKDLPRILPCLDLVVHPVVMEGLGVSLLQASAAGVPLVGANVGGVPEIIRHGENGLLFRPGDVEQLKSAILQLAGDAETRDKMGQKGKEVVKNEFSIPGMVRRNLEAYGDILIDHVVIQS